MAADIINQGIRVLDIEAKAILELKSRLGDSFVKAVEAIVACKGKVVTTGMGKSGQIARKIASTLSSTGTPAVFIHPAESSHGDLGLITDGDVILAFSYGGEQSEFGPIISYALRKDIPLVAVTGNVASTLGKAAMAILDIRVSEEACPLNLAPTASSTASLAMGDALAMAVLERRGFTAQDFATYHPGGSLGAKLLTRVRDVMHTGQALPLVELETSVKQVLSIMTHKDVRGAAGVIDGSQDLVGVITDGDIRRRLERSQDPLQGVAKDLMTVNPRTIDASEFAEKALFLMEQFKIQMVFVLDKESPTPRKPVGILHIQDLLRAKIR